MEEAALVGLQDPTNQFDRRQVAYARVVPLTQPNYCDRHNRHQSQARYQMIPGNREVTIPGLWRRQWHHQVNKQRLLTIKPKHGPTMFPRQQHNNPHQQQP